MPIKIPKDLPAADVLRREHIFVMDTLRATTQDIRPLKILMLNLMPTKAVTETQIARLLGNTPLQIELELVKVKHDTKNTSQEHMIAFYRNFSEIKENFYDGMIITGAPVEHLPFGEVDYWDELCEIMDWSTTHVFSTLHICWAAQAALFHHYGIEKKALDQKLFGVFDHTVEDRACMLFRGFDDVFRAPHSRHTALDEEALRKEKDLAVLASSVKAGPYAIADTAGRKIFITGHCEYDADTLRSEYVRDKTAGLPIEIPENYFPGDDDTASPLNTWRSGASLLYSNWLNYYVYQETPYIVESIGDIGR